MKKSLPERSIQKLLPVILSFSLLCSPMVALASAQQYESFENVRFIENYDGDSITFDIPDTPAIVGKNMVVRLRGIDTPELKKKSCPAAREKAQQAKELVHSLLTNARTIRLHRIGRGKYFRILADVEFDGKDLAAILIEKNLAVQYSGGKKTYDWCNSTDTSETGISRYPRSTLPPKISGVYVWPPPPVPKSENDK